MSGEIQRIEDNLVETFEAIDGTGAFTMAVKSVVIDEKDTDVELSPDDFPIIQLMQSGGPYGEDLNFRVPQDFQFDALMFLVGPNPKRTRQMLNTMRDNMRYALFLDPHRGIADAGPPVIHNATTTFLVDEQVGVNEGGLVGQLRLIFVCRYFFDVRSAPEPLP